jgi:hypothetical protein
MDWVWAEASLMAVAWLAWGGVVRFSGARESGRLAYVAAPWILFFAGLAEGPWGLRGRPVDLGLWVLAVAGGVAALKEGLEVIVSGAVAVLASAVVAPGLAGWPVVLASVVTGGLMGVLGGTAPRGAMLAALATAGAGLLRPSAFSDPGQPWLWAIWSTGLAWAAGHMVTHALRVTVRG